MQLVRVLLLAAAIAVGTFAFGWWAVPVIGALWGIMGRKSRGTGLVAGLAAALGWAALLAVDAWRGPVGPLADTLGTLLTLKAVGVYAVTLALPGLLALTAALVTRSVATGRS